MELVRSNIEYSFLNELLVNDIIRFQLIFTFEAPNSLSLKIIFHVNTDPTSSINESSINFYFRPFLNNIIYSSMDSVSAYL